MDVLLDEDEEFLRDTARALFERESPPARVRAVENAGDPYDRELWKRVADLGWLGLSLPEAYGGAAAPFSHTGVLFEEIGRALAPIPIHAHAVAALTIAEAGNAAQRESLLPPAIRGELRLSFALFEERPGLEPDAIRLRAQRDGEAWRLYGEKHFVDAFDVTDRCLVACRSESGSGGDGISLVVVDPRQPGVAHTLHPTLAGDRQAVVRFDGARVPDSAVLSVPGRAGPVVRAMLERAVILNCAMIVGATRMASERAFAYASKRVAFGRPIGSFQAIQHMCANMITWVDGAELLVREALWRISQGLPASTEVAAAKAFTNERCQAALREANQIHGGIAQIKEYDQQLWYRRAAAWTMRFGTAFEHRRTVARALGLRRG